MPLHSYGWEGTLDEAEFAKLLTLLGRGPVVNGPDDFKIVPIAGQRRFRLIKGGAYATGIRTDSDADQEIAVPTPTDGAFYLVVIRRDWTLQQAATDTPPRAAIEGASIELLQGATTSNTRPTMPPATMPTIASEPGVKADQILGWVWATSSSTDLVVFDARTRAISAEGVATKAGLRGLPANRVYVGKEVFVDDEATWYRRCASVVVDGVTYPADWYPVSGTLPAATFRRTIGAWDVQHNVVINALDANRLEAPVSQGGMTAAFAGGFGSFTVPVSGWYRLYGYLPFFSNGGRGQRDLHVNRNSTEYASGSLGFDSVAPGDGVAACCVRTEALLTAGDVVRWWAFQNSGGFLSVGRRGIEFWAADCQFAVSYIRPPSKV